MKNQPKKEALVIGSGPAGLTAAYELAASEKLRVLVLEKDGAVGGLAKTIEYKRCNFDIGPHHYITDSERVLKWWMVCMGNDFVTHKRFTRIYYQKRFFHYPLEPFNVIKNLTLSECLRCVASYVKVRFFPVRPVASFQDWVTNKFGYRLYSMFFKTYTEKVWGISCTQLSADWAAQRIKGFSLAKAIFYAFFGRWITKNKPRTICDVFYYPVYGSGFLWERIASSIKSHDHARLALNTEVVSIEHDNHMITSVWSRSAAIKTGASQLKHHGIDYLISSMPLRHFILAMDPLPPDQVVQAAQALRYRGLVTVNLIVNKVNISPDHWIYIHDKHVYVGRVGNMNNFSLKMIDDATKHTVMCLEYFSYTNEPLWAMSDHDLVALGGQELENIGLVKKSDVLDGMVVRVPEAYPVYDEGYKERLDIVLTYLAQFSNLSLIGRNGLHRYNNMDAAMLTAFEAVDKILMNEQSLTLHQQSPVQSHSSL